MRVLMFLRHLVGAGVATSLLAMASLGLPEAAAPQGPGASVAGEVAATQQALVGRYCLTCHNDRLETAGLSLEGLDPGRAADHAEVWELAARKVRAGMMPPAGMPAPPDEARAAFVTFVESALDRAALTDPDPGRPLVHRLNRAEYANAIRDLLELEVDASTLLPPDDASSAGFDNIADVLGVSPLLIESYLSAAGRISALAVGDRSTPPMGEVYRVRQDASQSRHVEGLPLGTVGGFAIERNIPLDGEYLFQVKLFRTNLGTMRGLEHPHHLEISVDGERVHLAAFGGDEDVSRSSANPTLTGDEIDERFTVRVPLRAGRRTIAVAFLEKTHAYNSRRLQSFVRSSADTIDFSGHPHIDQFLMTGPFDPSGVGETPSQRRIFVCRPDADATAAAETTCAREILSPLARRAYRGHLTDDDLTVLLDFFARGREESGTFDGGIELALRRVLASPKFTFRVERAPAGTPPARPYRLPDPDLASRLSFFLWSSIPDEELLDLASQGRLSDPGTLEQQVRRMLADPKAGALVANFAGQWLHLRNLRNKQPNSFQFPDFDDDLRRSMIQETELFFRSVMDEDRSVLDLMTADYTFLDERLARHYGIRGVYGSHVRRVTIDDDARRGLLGKGAILMATSHAHRTSPVLRGKWILENIVGVAPAPPPDDVPALSDEERPDKPLSGREALEHHRANPACSSCHRVLDPLGLALEHFDAVGAWRTRDGGTLGDPIDASGELVDGTHVDGVNALRDALMRQPETFVRTLTEKLLTYAIGRGLTAADQPVVRAIVRGAERDEYRFSSLVLGIVQSPPFRMRMAGSDDEDGGQGARIAAR